MPYTNYEKQKEYSRQYQWKNRDKIRQNTIKIQEERKKLVFDLLGDSCKHCGFNDKRALQIDHINGGGSKQHKQFSSRKMYLRYVLEVGGKEYQILCANCNWIKRAENGEERNHSKASGLRITGGSSK